MIYKLVNEPEKKYVSCSPTTRLGIHYYNHDEAVQPDLIPHIEQITDETNEYNVYSLLTGERADILEERFIPRAKELGAFVIRMNGFDITQRDLWEFPTAYRANITYYRQKKGSTLKKRTLAHKNSEIYYLGRELDINGNSVKVIGLDEGVSEPSSKGLEKVIEFEIKIDDKTKKEFIEEFPGVLSFGDEWLLREIYFRKIGEILEEQNAKNVIETDYGVKRGNWRISSGPEGSFVEFKVKGKIAVI